MWSNSKAGGEFFSSAPDGQTLWWDMRKLSAPVDSLVLDFERSNEPNIETALSASCMEYDPSMPNKFLVGTDQGKAENHFFFGFINKHLDHMSLDAGIVLYCNRKARSTAERIMCHYEAHLGPVRVLHRHPQLPKVFMTIGDWSSNIWAEDVRDSPILSLK